MREPRSYTYHFELDWLPGFYDGRWFGLIGYNVEFSFEISVLSFDMCVLGMAKIGQIRTLFAISEMEEKFSVKIFKICDFVEWRNCNGHWFWFSRIISSNAISVIMYGVYFNSIHLGHDVSHPPAHAYNLRIYCYSIQIHHTKIEIGDQK